MDELTLPTITHTEDGSLTLYSPISGEHYHSIHGAIQESQHIFIRNALEHRAIGGDRHRIIEHTDRNLYILEIGFGTGLNALLSLRWASEHGLCLDYTTLELYPVPEEVYRQLSYRLGHDADTQLQALHDAPWNIPTEVGSLILKKLHVPLEEYEPTNHMNVTDDPSEASPDFIDIIYFDAFSPETQPELWTEEIFARLYASMRDRGVLTTYCAKGEVRRRLQRVGFLVERLPGPPGKREILRATKYL